MDWELSIPKILHVYWGGGSLSYLRYLTVETFMKYNPDWEIRFYYPTHPTTHMTWFTPEQKHAVPTTDFVPKLMELPITKIPVNFNDYGYPNDIPEVHKSDILRLILLSTVGGLWSDMDIFYFKPMSWFYLNHKKNRDIQTFYCNREYGHSIGFLMAAKENRFFAKLSEGIKGASKFMPLNYQTFGATMYNRYFRGEGSVEAWTPAINISMDVVYAHRAGDTVELLSAGKPKFTRESIGIHWYAGDPEWKDFLIKTDGGLKDVPDSIIGRLINKERGMMKYITDIGL